jgi:hypothetical protein
LIVLVVVIMRVRRCSGRSVDYGGCADGGGHRDVFDDGDADWKNCHPYLLPLHSLQTFRTILSQARV